MKDIQLLVEKEDIHEFSRNLWRSEFFRKNYDEKGLVYKAVEQFSGLPRVFFWPSQDIENPHFSAWWGGIQMREYDSDLIHDLYYLHEIWHAGSMIYMRDMEFPNFQRKMIDNELEASVISEMAIYHEMPEIRKHTFDYEIFVDRFLFSEGHQSEPDAKQIELWQTKPELVIANSKLQRRNVMMAQNPNMDDDVEFWIQKFTHQNESWGHLWFARYNMVESAMLNLIDDSVNENRKVAAERFMAWLQSDEVCKGTDIPFPDEAHAFYGVYVLNKNLYKSTFEKINHTEPVSYKPLAEEFNPMEPGQG